MKILSLFDGYSTIQQACKNLGIKVNDCYASEIDEYARAVTFANMPKEAKEVISQALGVEPVMINASLVSAQNRKRLFWVGKWNGEKYEQVEIPQPEDRGILLKDILESNVDEKYYVKVSEKSKAMTATMWKGYGNDGVTTVRVGSLNSGGQGDRIYSIDGKSTALSANGGGRGAKTGLYAVALTEQRTEEAKAIRRENMKNGKDFSPRRAKELVPRKDEKSNTITTGQTKESLILADYQIRKLTTTECLRLQSMPDDYFDKAEYKGKPISNTQRYKMCGNAFNCAVIEHILKNIWKTK